jgi:hypothetical protein
MPDRVRHDERKRDMSNADPALGRIDIQRILAVTPAQAGVTAGLAG